MGCSTRSFADDPGLSWGIVAGTVTPDIHPRAGPHPGPPLLARGKGEDSGKVAFELTEKMLIGAAAPYPYPGWSRGSGRNGAFLC